jgi:GntR family transcriptional regulator/MocR family aminotransferase
MSWAEVYPWSAPDRSGPVVRQVYAQVRGAILAGALGAGARLPSSRDLATRLGVARASVVSAFDQLLAEGYVEGRRGAGTFVAADLSAVIDAPHAQACPSDLADEPVAADPLDPPITTLPGDAPFNTGRTLLDARATAAWSRAARRALRSLGPEHFGYADPVGDANLRTAIAEYLRAARGVRCEAEQVIVTSGAQHAVDIVARTLATRGERVWVEDPGYPSTVHALSAAGAVLAHIPVDAEGLVVAAGLATAPGAKAAFVTPSHQYPLGATLSMGRRLELLAWARGAGAWIVEDDFSSEFRYAGPPLTALQGLDGGERVIYVGTFNKAIFPGLRLGYLVAPRALVPALTQARRLMDRQPSSLTQAIVLDFMREGEFAAHIRRRRIAYKAQRDALVEALSRYAIAWLTAAAPDQGMHLVAYLADGLSDLAVESAASDAGLIVRAISPLYRRATPRQGLMLGFSGFAPGEMARPAERLGQVLKRLA